MPLPLTPAFAQTVFVVSTILMLASLHRPLRALGVFIVFRPLLQPAATLGYALGPIGISPVLPLLLVAAALLNSLLKGRFFFKEVTPLYLMLLASLPSLFITLSLVVSVGFYVKIFTGIAAFLIAANNVKTQDELLYVFKAFALSAVIPLVFGLYQYVTGTGHMYESEYHAGSRIDSVFMYWNAYGEYLAILICLLIMRYTNKSWQKPGLLSHVLFVGTAISFLLALNRGSWLALAFGLTAAVLFYRGVIKLRWVLLGGLLVALFAGGMIAERFDELDSVNAMGYRRDTFQGRVSGWIASLELLAEHPLTGLGAGTSVEATAARFGQGYALHNDYLRILFECGPLSFLCYAFFMAINLGAHLRLKRLQDVQAINFSMFAFTVYYFVISFVQNIIGSASIFPLVLTCLGLARASVNIARNNTGNEEFQEVRGSIC